MRKQDLFKTLIKSVKGFLMAQRCKSLLEPLKKALSQRENQIPVLVVSYNNGVYVANTVKQLSKYSISPIILDNRSTSQESISILQDIEKSGQATVIYGKKNLGHLVGFFEPVYSLLPEVFAYTDPDLEFNADLPPTFLEDLAALARKYRCYKAGFALAIPAQEPITSHLQQHNFYKPFKFSRSYTIAEWEARYWTKRLADPQYEVYAADIDTTFAVYVKSNYRGYFMDAVRVGGGVAALHLPWFPNLDLMNGAQKQQYLAKNKSTTWIK